MVALFPDLPRFSSLVYVQYSTRRREESVYYTERKPKNENGGGLGTRRRKWLLLDSQKLENRSLVKITNHTVENLLVYRIRSVRPTPCTNVHI